MILGSRTVVAVGSVTVKAVSAFSDDLDLLLLVQLCFFNNNR